MADYLDQLKPRLTSIGQRAEIIEKSPWMKDFTWPQIKQLAEFVEIYDVPEKTELFSEGAKATYLGVVVKGVVIVRKLGRDNKYKVIASLGAGKSFGEMSIFDGSPRSASIKVKETATLIILRQEKFDKLLDVAAKLGALLLLKLGRLMSANLRRTSGQLIDALGDNHQ